MHKNILLGIAVVGVIGLLAADYAYAKGWCGGGGARSAAGQARTQPGFTAPTFATTTGEKATEGAYFDSIREVKEAAKAGNLSLLYVYDTSTDAQKVANFETALFKNENLAIGMKVFRLLKLDVAKDPIAKGVYGTKLPRFIAFDAKGERTDEVYLAGYKASASTLLKALVKAAKGHGTMPLMTFVDKYRSFLNELDKIEGKKGTFQKKKERLAKSGKAANLDKEEAEIAKEEAAVLEGEKKLLEAVKAFVPANPPRVLVQK